METHALAVKYRMNKKSLKVFYVLNARFPTKRAYGIQTAKMCEAFIEQEIELTLLVPSTAASRGAKSVREFYGLRVDVPLRRLPNPDWYSSGRLGYVASSFIFMAASLAFLLVARLRGKADCVYTVDMDSFSHTLLPIAGNVVAEMHSPKRASIPARFFFGRARGVVAANPLIAAELRKTFGRQPVVEPNGVDESNFSLPPRAEARARLGLPPDETLVLYVGRFLAWKGLEILPAAAERTPGLTWRALGGTRAEFETVFGEAKSLQFAEAEPAEVSLWLAAADVLLVIGTRRDEYSYRYTTPMKVFEYLAVVASDTPALRSFVPEDAVVYCAPDEPAALAVAVQKALVQAPEAQRGVALAREHTWASRAARIVQSCFQ